MIHVDITFVLLYVLAPCIFNNFNIITYNDNENGFFFKSPIFHCMHKESMNDSLSTENSFYQEDFEKIQLNNIL